jgi:hypothetical protein
MDSSRPALPGDWYLTASGCFYLPPAKMPSFTNGICFVIFGTVLRQTSKLHLNQNLYEHKKNYAVRYPGPCCYFGMVGLQRL